MNKFNLIVKSKDFTPTRCHYYVTELIPQITEDELVNTSKSFIKVYFQDNPVHAYIKNCIETNMPITIKAETIVIPTPFTYVPHIKKEGIEIPLLALHYDLESNTYQKRKVKMNTFRITLDEHELPKKESIINKHIRRLKKWKTK